MKFGASNGRKSGIWDIKSNQTCASLKLGDIKSGESVSLKMEYQELQGCQRSGIKTIKLADTATMLSNTRFLVLSMITILFFYMS